MMKSSTIRMDEALRKEASLKLESIGLNFNTFVVMATKQLVAQNRIPFDLTVPEPVPNETTRRALIEAEAKELGLIADDSPAFDSTGDLMAFLDND